MGGVLVQDSDAEEARAAASARVAPPPAAPGGAAVEAGRWLLVGAPNVGKSAVFGRLTGTYATVSNYPGTSVEVSRGHAGAGGTEVLDAPGLYSALALTEEERVARRAAMEERAQVILHVVDASHLDRSLPLTLQLLSLGRPLVLVCNVMDEARSRGVVPDLGLLSERLGVPVVGTVATRGEGIEALAAAARGALVPADGWGTPEPFATEVVTLAAMLPLGPAAHLSAELALAGDEEHLAAVAELAPDAWAAATARRDAAWENAEGFALGLATSRRRMVLALLDGVVPPAAPARRRSDALDRVFLSPWAGFLVVAAALYLAFYEFVGTFGAGTAVDWVEGVVFSGWLLPLAESAVHAVVPWAVLQDLLVGEYGLLTLGLRYAVAIVLPIVGAFFLVFSIFEDSGYLPRLALLLDRAMKRLGLSGRAVLPLVLGFGCGTMATLVTRTLETRRERVIATLLLALAIPCSAQLGVVLGILSVAPGAALVWGLILLGVFTAVGALAARFVPGETARFYLELPPLRLPGPRNVLVKTVTRVRWYLAEILPLFLLASLILWLGDLTGALQAATRGLEPVVGAIGLPDAAAPAFLYGFLRRDFGAAGLYDLAARGVLGPAALTTAAVTITLFVPCLAQFLVMRRERGLRTALTVLAVATTVAFVVGGLVGWTLRAVGGWE